jgi:hypothetical protein
MQNELDATTAAVEAEVSRIQSLNPDEVRALWRDTFKKDVPKVLTRDLLVRTLFWHIQEKAFGGHSSAILKLNQNGSDGDAALDDVYHHITPVWHAVCRRRRSGCQME